MQQAKMTIEWKIDRWGFIKLSLHIQSQLSSYKHRPSKFHDQQEATERLKQPGPREKPSRLWYKMAMKEKLSRARVE